MAKKDEFDFDDVGMEDIGYDSPMDEVAFPKKDRSPVTAISSGALTGVKNAAKNPAFYRGVLKQALPSSYGTTFNAIDDVTSEGVGLYNSLREDLRPATRQIKRSLRIVQKSVDAVTPEWISKKLTTLLADKDGSSHTAPTREEMEDTAIAGELNSIFKLTAENANSTKADNLMKDAVETKRHATNTEYNSVIAEHLARLTSYQDQIGNAFQRKSLELQYRSFYAQRELLEVTKATTEESIVLLRSVVKNTGLPEYQKIESSEAMAELARTKLFGLLQDKAHTQLRPFLRDTSERLRKNLGGKVRETIDGFNSGAEMLEMANDQLDMAREMGQDPNELIGELAGESAFGAFGRKMGRKVRPHLEKNKAIVGAGLKSSNFFSTLVGRLQDWSNTSTDSFGFGGEMLNILKGSVSGKDETKVIAQDVSADLTKHALFTNRAHITLVDIIPGLLSRQLQSLEGIRTGSTPDLAVWDFAGSGFTSRTAMAGKILRNVFKDEDVESVVSRGQNIVDTLDLKVSDDDRLKIVNAIIEKSKSERYFNAEKFGQPSFYDGLLDEKNARKVATAIRAKTGTNQDGSTDIENVDGLKSTRNLIQEWTNIRALNNGNGAEAAAKAFNSGYQDIVKQLGISQSGHGTDTYNANYLNSKLDMYRANGGDYEKTAQKILDSSGVVHVPNVTGPNSSRTNDGYSRFSSSAPVTAPSDTSRIKEAATKQSQTVDFAEVIQRIDAVGERVERTSSREAVEESLTWLERILAAIQANGTGGDYSGSDGGSGGPSGKPGLFRRGLRGIGSAGRWAGKHYVNGVKGIYKGAWNIAKAPFKAAKWLMNRNRVEDVYLAGRPEASLTQAGFLAGEYFDAITGKVISSIKDIKGAVKNRTGDTIITHEEFLRGIFDKTGRKINLGRGWLRDKLSNVGSLLTLPFKPMKLGFQMLNSLRKTGADILFDVPDIYVPGEPSPRILSKLLRGGTYYFVGLKAISRLSQIVGDVKDRNGKVVLSLEEFARGVVDHQGEPIRTNTAKLKSLAMLPWTMAKGAFGLAKRGVSKGMDLVRRGASGLVNGFKGGINIGGSSNSRSVLIKIHNLMVDKWGVGEHLADDSVSSKVGSVFNKLRSKVKDGTVSDTVSKVTSQARDRINDLRTKHNLTAKDIAGWKWPDAAKGKMNDLRAGFKDKTTGMANSIKSKLLGTITRKKDARDIDGDGDVDLEDMASFITGKKLTKRKSIKERLDERLNTDRKGSWREILAKRAAAGKDKVVGKFGKGKGKGEGESWMPKIFGLLTGALSLFGGMWGSIKGMASTLMAIKAASTAGALMDGVGGIDGGGKSKGKRGVIRKVAGGIGRGIAALGTGALAVGRGALSLTGGAIGMVARAGMMALGAAGTVLSAPVVLGAAAVAAVAVGGYYAYKYFTDKLTPLQRLRMAQYGIPEDNKDFIVKTAEVEHKLKDSVMWEGDRATKVNMSAKLLKAVLEIYGVDYSDVAAVRKMENWLHARFMPVYLTNLTALRSVDPRADLVATSSTLTPAVQLQFIKRTVLDSTHSAYQFSGNVAEGVDIISGSARVENVYDSVKDELTGKATSVDSKDKTKTVVANAERIRTQRTAKTTAEEQNLAMMKARMDQLNKGKVKPTLPTIKTAPPKSVGTAKMLDSVLKGRKGFNGESVTIRPTGTNSILRDPSPVDPNGAYASIPKPSGDGKDNMRDTIVAAANIVGVSPALSMALAAIESNFRAGVKASTSSATGLYQFIDSTWSSMMSKHAKTYGIPADAVASDPVASALLGAKLMKEDVTSLKGAGINTGPTEAYMSHLLGSPSAKKFLMAKGDAIAAGIVPAAAASNPNIFYRDGRPVTVDEVYQHFAKKVNVKMSEAGVETMPSDAFQPKVKDEEWAGATTTTPGMSATERLLAAGTTPTDSFIQSQRSKMESSSPAAQYTDMRTPITTPTGSNSYLEQDVVANIQDRTASDTETVKYGAVEARLRQASMREGQSNIISAQQQKSNATLFELGKATTEIGGTLKESLVEQRETNKLLSMLVNGRGKEDVPAVNGTGPNNQPAPARQRFVNNVPVAAISSSRNILG